ncbi:hypothetical protein EJB05_48973 [Eragrostis curvula]|uniref:Uncharacterized protein n=1 Tax=Eragrostis curvula TaxID=38414 RepID=A0A5J9T345_9POAL|nr:hypothetical protein EJB05_48973 [Eragrostis curvula]
MIASFKCSTANATEVAASSDAQMEKIMRTKPTVDSQGGVDPKPISATVQYISHLQNRIFDLQQELETTFQNQELVIGIAGPDTFCLDPYCTCPHHKSRPTNPPPQASPPPPNYGGYNDYGYSPSGGESNYSP